MRYSRLVPSLAIFACVLWTTTAALNASVVVEWYYFQPGSSAVGEPFLGGVQYQVGPSSDHDWFAVPMTFQTGDPQVPLGYGGRYEFQELDGVTDMNYGPPSWPGVSGEPTWPITNGVVSVSYSAGSLVCSYVPGREDQEPVRASWFWYGFSIVFLLGFVGLGTKWSGVIMVNKGLNE